MEEDDHDYGYEMLDVLHDVMVSDRTFFNSIRYLDGHQRSNAVIAHLRNTAQALHIIRQNAMNPPPTTTRMVFNVPLNLDLSGNSFFDPVPVVPTQAHINRAVDTHVMVSDTTCSICQEPVTCATRIRGCGHCFHGSCIQQWFSLNPRCPMCRHDIRQAPAESVLQDVSGIPTSNESHRVHSHEES